jgi:hypothetical protein
MYIPSPNAMHATPITGMFTRMKKSPPWACPAIAPRARCWARSLKNAIAMNPIPPRQTAPSALYTFRKSMGPGT